MSTELLNYCVKQLRSRPQALNISQPLDKSTCTTFVRAWARTRFEHQQLSILKLSPDHPDYGRGYLWPYELQWTEQPGSNWLLRIQKNLRNPAAPRELILLASVSETNIPFLDVLGASLPRHVFRAAKSRMLGGEIKRNNGPGVIAPGLRPAVASVQYSCQKGIAYISAIILSNVVSIEN